MAYVHCPFTRRLLYSVLPKSVANELRHQRPVPPKRWVRCAEAKKRDRKFQRSNFFMTIQRRWDLRGGKFWCSGKTCWPSTETETDSMKGWEEMMYGLVKGNGLSRLINNRCQCSNYTGDEKLGGTSLIGKRRRRRKVLNISVAIAKLSKCLCAEFENNDGWCWTRNGSSGLTFCLFCFLLF